MRPRSVRLVAACVAVTLVAACNGGDDATSTSSSPSVETTDPTPPSSEPESTTTTSTSSTSTTTTSTSTTSTTDPPTTTSLPEGVPPRVTFPDDPDAQAVVDALYAYLDALDRAQADPADSALRDALAATVIEPIKPRVLAFLDRLVDDGRAFLTPAERPSYIDIVPDISINLDSALVDGCAVDRSIEVKVGANPDGTDQLLDDSVVSVFQSYNLTRTEAGWKVSDLTLFDRWEDQEGCG